MRTGEKENNIKLCYANKIILYKYLKKGDIYQNNFS